MDKLKENFKKHLQTICLTYPTRHTASEGERFAADYIEKYFLGLGIKCRREEYPVRGWDYKEHCIKNASKNEEIPTVTVCYFSGKLDFVGKLTVLEKYEDVLEKDVKGKVCLLAFFTGDVFKNNEIAEDLEKLGALGVIFYDESTNNGLASTKICRSPFINKIAVMAVSNYGLRYLLANIEDDYSIYINAMPYDTITDNVIGYIEGGDKKAVFGAHYDAAPLIEGADDDASGVAMLLETARILRDCKSEYTIEFVAFSGEEYIAKRGTVPEGSGDYVKRHKDEVAWYFNFDSSGTTSKLMTKYTLGIGHIEKLQGIDFGREYQDATMMGDDKAFVLSGIPTIWLQAVSKEFFYHTPNDNVKSIDFNAMCDVYKEMYGLMMKLL